MANSATPIGNIQTPDGLTRWQFEYLCAIFCFCLGQWRAQKNEAEMGLDLSVVEPPTSKRPRPPGRFERQGCVEDELRDAGHDTLIPEQRFNMNQSPPVAGPGGTGRIPDVTVLAGAGPIAGANIAAVVEMKFPGDDWSAGQENDYNRIAQENNPADGRVVLLNEETCGCGA